MWRKILNLFLLSHVAIAFLMLIKTQETFLLRYINSSFIVGGLLFFLGLTFFLLSSGFFDLTAYAFRRVFTINGQALSKKEVDEMRNMSELVTIDYVPFMVTGSLILLCMGMGLFIYY